MYLHRRVDNFASSINVYVNGKANVGRQKFVTDYLLIDLLRLFQTVTNPLFSSEIGQIDFSSPFCQCNQ